MSDQCTPSEPRLAVAATTAWRLLGLGALVVGTWWLARHLFAVLLPSIIAVLLAALLRPVAGALERRRIPPAAAALMAVGLLVLVVAAAIALIVPPFVARIGEVGTNVERGLHEIAFSVAHGLTGATQAEADRMVDQALSALQGEDVANNVLAGATAALHALASIVLTAFLCFFLVKDGRAIATWLLGFVPEQRRDSVADAAADAWRGLAAYIRGVIFVATVDAAFIGLALLIVGVPLVLPLIVLTWLAAFFPIIGAVVAGIAAVLVALVAEGLGAAIAVALAIIGVQQLEGNVLYPVLVGPRLRLHPIAVLLAVTIGATIGGVAGAFLAVPVATVIAVVLHREHEREPPLHVDLPVGTDPIPVATRPLEDHRELTRRER